MGKYEMEIAIKAANFLEQDSVIPNLYDYDVFLDPDVDEETLEPFVMITIDKEGFNKLSKSIPDKIKVFDRDVSIIVKSLSMDMN